MLNDNEILSRLSPEDAAAVLGEMVRNDADIARRAAEIANELLKDSADVEGIAADVQMELDFLDVEDLWDRSGGQRDGYHEPGEEAFDMCEEALQPVLEQWRRSRELNRTADAKYYCMGILLGLHQFETTSETEFRKWAEDVPGCLAEQVLSTWTEWCPSPEANDEVVQFLQENCPRFT
jgi:hypothetical protein